MENRQLVNKLIALWYLKKYKDGEFCTLPHVIELMQADYDAFLFFLKWNG